MVVVHHLENSRSQRVIWLLEELQIPYGIKQYKRDAVTKLAPAILKEVHPLGKSPVITHDGRVIAETGAIVDYIVTRLGNGRLRPDVNSDEYLRYNYWSHFAEGSAMPPLVMRLVIGSAVERAPFFAKPFLRAMDKAINQAYLGPTIEGAFDLMEAELAKGGWFAGDRFSAADVMMSFPLEAAGSRGGIGNRPRLKDWLERIHDRPAYRVALEKGGPYAYA